MTGRARALPAVSAIVLAGGRSARFGRDKLVEQVGDAPLVARAVESVAPLAAEVVIVLAPRAPEPRLVATDVRVRVVRDPVAFHGPGIGIRVALDVASEPLALVVAGDMPRLARPVLELLVRTLATADAEVVDAVALAFRGRRQPFPAVVRVGAATVAAQLAAGAGDASVRGLLGRLRTREIEEALWRPLDPAAATLTDVDRPEDLAALGR